MLGRYILNTFRRKLLSNIWFHRLISCLMGSPRRIRGIEGRSREAEAPEAGVQARGNGHRCERVECE